MVHARGGERSDYPPLQSRLCGSSRPVDVVAGLLSLYPFRYLYIADLDAISRAGDHSAVVAALHTAYAGLQLWVDAGIRTRADYLRLRSRLPGTMVAGSETLLDTGLLESDPEANDLVLSLDYRNGRALGASGIESHPGLWPNRIICMSLDRVGGTSGPDIGQLLRLRQASAGCEIFAAGGIRDSADLARLRDSGVDGALLASALHNGSINGPQLRLFA